MSLSIQIRGTGTVYTTVGDAKTADDAKKLADPTTAGAWTVSGAPNGFTDSELALLQTNKTSLNTVEVTGDSALVLTGAKVRSYKDVILKLTAQKLAVTDTASGLGGNNYSSLDAVYAKISAITVSDNLNVSVAYSDYQTALTNSHEAGLEDKIKAGSTGGNTSGVAITNFSGSKANLDVALADGDVKSVTIKDTIANLALNTSSIIGGTNSGKIAAGTGVVVADTLANIKADGLKTDATKTLNTAMLAKVASVSITLSGADVSAANFTTINNLPTAIKSKLNIIISGTAASIGANLASITALGSKVSSIETTGGASISDLTKLSTVRDKFTSVELTDTGANLAKASAIANAKTSWSSKISAIKILGVPSSAEMGTILGAAAVGQSLDVSISDTSAKINADLALTNSVIRSNISNLSSIAVTDGTAQAKAVLKMSKAQYDSIKDKFTGQKAFDLSSVAYAALNTVDNDVDVKNYSIKDTFSSLGNQANIQTLLGKSKLLGLDITNATVENVSTTINTTYTGLTTPLKAKLKSVSVTDAASTILGTTTFNDLGANKLVTSINANNATIGNIATLKTSTKLASITVLDTDANYSLASNAALIGDAKVTSFSLTEVPASKLGGNSGYNSNPKITSMRVSDTSANIAATIALNGMNTMNDAKITDITANAALISQIAGLSATTGANGFTKPVSINVADTWTNIKTYFVIGPGNAAVNEKVKSFSVSLWS